MRITGGKVVVCGPGRNFVTLELDTAGDVSGLGVEIDEALAATFPCDAAYLPMARLADGTLHDW
jgi:hypothetical protein